jgi:lipopolysaccharide export system permease protein
VIFKHQAEWHRKFTLSFACFVLFFIGAPLGAIIRKGGLGLPVVISVLFFVLFHIISITGEKSVKSGVIDANLGMWIAPLVLLPLGVFLTFKATTDSPLLDPDAWVKLINKIVKRKKN